MDELVSAMSSSMKVDPNAMGEHPRYSMFKNSAKPTDQQALRRQQALERQEQARWAHLSRLRRLAYEDEPSSDEEEGNEEENEKAGRSEESEMQEESASEDRRAGGEEQKGTDVHNRSSYSETGSRSEKTSDKNRYKDVLMTSEWLVDIPEALSTDWYMVVCPKGRRVLVVASGGSTAVYNKAGRVLRYFASNLPGGNRRSHRTFTILDGVLVNDTMYCLDCLAWGEHAIGDSGYEFRLWYLKSRMSDEPELYEKSKKCKVDFVIPPHCLCEKLSMEQLMNTDFQFPIDGLLFYHKDVYYTPGQSPLVGWLKPWMLPEILGVPVPSKYNVFNKLGQNTSQFIEDFNKKHHHKSQIAKDDEME